MCRPFRRLRGRGLTRPPASHFQGKTRPGRSVLSGAGQRCPHILRYALFAGALARNPSRGAVSRDVSAGRRVIAGRPLSSPPYPSSTRRLIIAEPILAVSGAPPPHPTPHPFSPPSPRSVRVHTHTFRSPPSKGRAGGAGGSGRAGGREGGREGREGGEGQARYSSTASARTPLLTSTGAGPPHARSRSHVRVRARARACTRRRAWRRRGRSIGSMCEREGGGGAGRGERETEVVASDLFAYGGRTQGQADTDETDMQDEYACAIAHGCTLARERARARGHPHARAQTRKHLPISWGIRGRDGGSDRY